jgi:CxxC-x17-CxxC domain-containing protein
VNPDDKIIQCVDCGVEFVFTAGEQAFYREHGLTNVPTRCRACREARKTQKPARPPGSRRRETARPAGEARAMHPAVCAGCGATTEIPFVPTAGRPVYCRDCFANRRAGEREARSGVRRGPRAPSARAGGDRPARSPSPPREPAVQTGDTGPPGVEGRQQGEVKWFNVTKGFGFIQSQSGEELFVHFSAIRGDGYRALTGGDRVEFDVVEGDKGKQAANVTKV